MKQTLVVTRDGQPRIVEEVPEGATAYRTRAEISTAPENARHLWEVMNRKHVRAKTKSGSFKHQQIKKIEVLHLTWERGEDWMRDKLYEKLQPVPKAILNVLLESGKDSWTADEARVIVKRNASRIPSRNVMGAYQKSLSLFFAYRLLKRGYLSDAVLG